MSTHDSGTPLIISKAIVKFRPIMVIEGVGTLGRVSRIFGATVKLPIIMVTILVCLLLVSGVYAVTYVTPNGDANIVQSAVEAAGFDLTHLAVPQIVPPGQELKLVVQGWACNTPNPWGKGTGGTNDPDGTNVVNLGCEMHASDPKPILGGFIRSFAVLTYNFGWATTSGLSQIHGSSSQDLKGPSCKVRISSAFPAKHVPTMVQSQYLLSRCQSGETIQSISET